jgi:hypothetical protein
MSTTGWTGTDLAPAPPIRALPYVLLVVGLVVGTGIGLALSGFVLPKPPAAKAAGPTAVLVTPFVNFTGRYPTPDWAYDACPAQWGLPLEPWNCAFSFYPLTMGPCQVQDVSTITPGALVEGIQPALPENCTHSNQMFLSLSIVLPANASASLHLDLVLSTE